MYIDWTVPETIGATESWSTYFVNQSSERVPRQTSVQYLKNVY